MDEKKENTKGIKKAAQAAGSWIKGHKAASIIILLVLLALIGLLIFLHGRSASKKIEPGEETAAIERKDLVQSLTLSGTVESGAAYSVTSKLTDVEVKQVNVKVGDTVKKGDVIAVLDDTDLRENLSSAQKNLSSTKKKNSQSISSAKRSLRNAEEDEAVQTGRTSKDVKTANAQYNAAVKELNAEKNKLGPARNALIDAERNKNTAETNAKPIHDGINSRKSEIDEISAYIEELEEEVIIMPPGPDADAKRNKVATEIENKHNKEVLLNKYKKDNEAVLKAESDAQAAYNAAQSNLSSIEEKVKAAEQKVANAKDARDKAVQTNEDTNRTTSRSVEEQEQALESAYDSASDNLEAPSKEVRKAQKDLDASKVVADADGIVTAVNVKPGDKYKGDAIAVVQDDSSYRVSATADQYDISSLAIGQQAEITINAAEMNGTEGRLIYVGSTPMVSETGAVGTSGGNTTTASSGGSGANYRVEAVIQQPSAKMRIGMTAKVVVTVWKKKDCLAVPDEAVRTDENGQNYVVVVDENGKKKNVNVEYGMKTDYYSEIIGKDLKEGMKVLVSGDESIDDDVSATEE
ncbi:MAG: biotin/lipoyl-binding protein [Mogibacterium sp.]|nr:biotin/lipoyl-binding protein [Mogibacterium sp.]